MRSTTEVLFVVATFQTRKDREAHTDPSHHFTFDPNLGPGNPLYHHFHRRSPPLKVDKSNDNSRPPSTVTIAT